MEQRASPRALLELGLGQRRRIGDLRLLVAGGRNSGPAAYWSDQLTSAVMAIDGYEWSELVPQTLAVPDALAARLERRIREGVIPPGSKLPPERELAELLGVSRGSVRGAMRELSLKGLLTRRPGIGTVVVDPPATANRLLDNLSRAEREAHELSDFRQVFEPHVTELAATRATRANVHYLEEIWLAGAETTDAATSVEYDEQFHSALAQATHNALLMILTDTTAEWVRDGRLEAQRRPGIRELSWIQHREILDAVAHQDGLAARRAMETHIQSFEQELYEASLTR